MCVNYTTCGLQITGLFVCFYIYFLCLLSCSGGATSVALLLCVDMNYSSCESVRLQMGVRCINSTHSGRRILSNIYTECI